MDYNKQLIKLYNLMTNVYGFSIIVISAFTIPLLVLYGFYTLIGETLMIRIMCFIIYLKFFIEFYFYIVSKVHDHFKRTPPWTGNEEQDG